MRNMFVIWFILVTLAILFPASALDAADDYGPLSETTGASITTQMQAMGVDTTKIHIDLNVKLSIPQQVRTDASGNPAYDENGAALTIPAVDLWAILVRPGGDKKLPTIVVPTCYRRDMFVLLYANLVLSDYNVLVVDIRGSGSSNGQWASLDIPEHYDIAYVIDTWIPAQTWSDGTVGMIGPSYLGITQLLTAGNVERDAKGEPTHLKAIFPLIPMSDVYKDIVVPGGMIDIEFMLIWLGITDMCALLPPLTALGDAQSPDMDPIQEAYDIWNQHYAALSLQADWLTNDETMRNDGDFYDRRSSMLYWPVKPDDAAAYGGWAYPEGGKTFPAKLPVFLTGGWYCIFTRGECNTYQYGLSKQALGDKAYLVGPWYHLEAMLGLGINGMMLNQVALRWFDLKIKGIGASFTADYPVLLYVMGADRWRAEKSWPLPKSRVQDKTYYLSTKKASSISGDWFSTSNQDLNFSLTEQPSIADYSGTTPVLKHNPANLHGALSRSSTRWMMGMPAIFSQISRYVLGQDIDAGQYWEDERKDEVGVLTFTTEPLAEDTEIAGPLKLSFWAKTEFGGELTQALIDQAFVAIKAAFNIGDNEDLMLDAMTRRDVQWIIEVNDVYPDGRAKNITSGWLSAWHRPYDPADPTKLDPDYKAFDPFYDHADKNPSPIEQGILYPYVIEVWPTDNMFKKGHRIRVSISASDFPHLLPNLRPSTNTLVIDAAAHQAKLDCTVVADDLSAKGTTWDWISDIMATDAKVRKQTNALLKEFTAMSQYLLTYNDSTAGAGSEDTYAEDSEEDNGHKAASSGDSGDGGGSGGGCFINAARL
ncbi:MAG: CocE/NonD family hydrolase [Syntrophaceae bacterium]